MNILAIVSDFREILSPVFGIIFSVCGIVWAADVAKHMSSDNENNQ